MGFLNVVVGVVIGSCVFWGWQTRSAPGAVRCALAASACIAVWVGAKVLFHVYGIPA
jgi:hypothetical protein